MKRFLRKTFRLQRAEINIVDAPTPSGDSPPSSSPEKSKKSKNESKVPVKVTKVEKVAEPLQLEKIVKEESLSSNSTPGENSPVPVKANKEKKKAKKADATSQLLPCKLFLLLLFVECLEALWLIDNYCIMTS